MTSCHWPRPGKPSRLAGVVGGLCGHGATRAHSTCSTSGPPNHRPYPPRRPAQCPSRHSPHTPHQRARTSASPGHRVAVGLVGTLADGGSAAGQAPRPVPTGALSCELWGEHREGASRSPGLRAPPQCGGPQTRAPTRRQALKSEQRWPRRRGGEGHCQSSKATEGGTLGGLSKGLGTGAAQPDFGKARKGSVEGDGRAGVRPPLLFRRPRGHPHRVPGCTGG